MLITIETGLFIVPLLSIDRHRTPPTLFSRHTFVVANMECGEFAAKIKIASAGIISMKGTYSSVTEVNYRHPSKSKRKC